MAQVTSETWDTRWSATRRSIDKTIVDNAFEPYRLLDLARKKWKKTYSGGTEISCLLESSTVSAQAFDGWDQLDKSQADPIETAHYLPRYYAVPIALSDTDSWENSGAEKVFDLLEAIGNNAFNSLLKAINEDMGSAQAAKNILGLQDLIADAAGATVGGINSGTSTFWENQRVTGSVDFLTQTATNVFNGIDSWNDGMDLARIQGGNIVDMLTTYSIVKAYRIALSSQGYARTAVDDAKGVGGDFNPMFYTAKVTADNDIAALHTYGISKGGLTLHVNSKANFKKTPFVSTQSNGQLGQLGYMVAGVQVTTNQRRRNVVHTALTGS